jgi:hypothetical protein
MSYSVKGGKLARSAGRRSARRSLSTAPTSSVNQPMELGVNQKFEDTNRGVLFKSDNKQSQRIATTAARSMSAEKNSGFPAGSRKAGQASPT